MKKSLYNPNKVYKQALDQIGWSFGLELRIVEKSYLRRLIPGIIEEHDKIDGWKHPHATFNVVGESITRFMVDYYGLPVEYAVAHTDWKKAPFLVEFPEQFKEYMRRRQEQEFHEI
ncbi:hypothetical protein HN747_01625 [archaeon]|jgi:hypothetical protein|nr:hypothetical protein [archaeon]